MTRLKLFRSLAAVNFAVVVIYVLWAYTSLFTGLQASLLAAVTPPQPIKLSLTQAAALGSLDPQKLAPNDQVALGLLYEPLVRFDQFFNVSPALAYAWYFRTPQDFVVALRSDALFQDGKKLTCADVAASLQRAQNLPESSVQALFAGVQVQPVADGKCEFRLAAADPNFARKLTRLFIIPAAAANVSVEEWQPQKAAGTGRYQLVSRTNSQIIFKAFPKYYLPAGDAPTQLTLLAEPNKYRRLALLKAKKTDVLLDVPASFVAQIEDRYGYQILRTPSATALFLLFNAKQPQLADTAARTALARRVADTHLSQKFSDTGLYALSQFAPSGVFGFQPDLLDFIPPESVPPTEKQFLSLAVSETNLKLAQILQAELEKQNIELTLHVLPEADLMQSLQAGEDSLYLLGWQYELGTTDDFFAKVLHSKAAGFGQLSGLGHATATRDAAIAKALAETDTTKRLQALQNLMQQAVTTDFVGAPLFGTRTLAATLPDAHFVPRMDGLIIFDTSDADH